MNVNKVSDILKNALIQISSVKLTEHEETQIEDLSKRLNAILEAALARSATQ